VGISGQKRLKGAPLPFFPSPLGREDRESEGVLFSAWKADASFLSSQEVLGERRRMRGEPSSLPFSFTSRRARSCPLPSRSLPSSGGSRVGRFPFLLRREWSCGSSLQHPDKSPFPSKRREISDRLPFFFLSRENERDGVSKLFEHNTPFLFLPCTSEERTFPPPLT